MEQEKQEFWHEGLCFSCTSCGHCCRHEPGYVFLSRKDINALAGYFGLSAQEFINRWCRSVHMGIASRISLRETPNYDCVFWDKGCSVYPVRPLQCRTYPFWAGNLGSRREWDEEARSCPGMNQGAWHSRSEIERAIKAREAEFLADPADNI